jgi:hypothetical protein
MIIPGEDFKPHVLKNKLTRAKYTDSEINEKYQRGEIRIITEQARYPLDSISTMIQSGKYNLNPEYQRRKRWGVIQQSKLIESFIINVPIPPIFIYEVDFANYEVMDGLQRLTAISEFYKDSYALEGLEEWNELNGRKYSQLPKVIKEGIDRRYLSSIILLNETAKDKNIAESLKQMVFGRLNSGGDKLTNQESRNALIPGKFNDFCISLSKNETFRKLWNYKLLKYSNGRLINEDELLTEESYRKMEDVEMVLRYFAYRHVEQLSNFKSQESFIDSFLKAANNWDNEVLEKLKVEFEETLELVFKVFGVKAFYMPDQTQKKNTPTKTIYDSIMQSFSKNLDKKRYIIENATKINHNKFNDFNRISYESKGKKIDLFDGKYNSKKNVIARITYFDELIHNSI